MADDVKFDEPQESSPELAEALASSPEVKQEAQQQLTDTQTPTAKQGDSQEAEEAKSETPFHEHPRFKELIDERNWYRSQMEQMMQRQQQDRQQPIQQQPQELGNTPEEREFWRMQRQIAREEAVKVATEKEKQINAAIEFLTSEVTTSKIQQFREKHPDVKPNSPEEVEIAKKINQGYKLEDAYRVVMWDRKFSEAESKVKQINQQKIEAKKQANVEQRSIPQQAMPKTNEKLTLRQRIEKAAEGLEF